MAHTGERVRSMAHSRMKRPKTVIPRLAQELRSRSKPPSFTTVVGWMFRWARERRGLSIDELSKRIAKRFPAISPAYLRQIERTARGLGLFQAAVIAHVLGTKASALLARAERAVGLAGPVKPSAMVRGCEKGVLAEARKRKSYPSAV